jgi:lipopolysaccharide/colanic/teichoic acid biosynthesis glycosyltransferase
MKYDINLLKFQQLIKGILDQLIAGIMLISLMPLLLIMSILIYFYLGNPVIFKQLRPGENGKIFSFYKFRSMTYEKDVNDNLLPDEKRLTKFGQYLRKSSLDELPQLWNVLKGDMSFVGPRPLLVEYLELYTPEQARRHQVKPGITGWAQINGRNAITWEEKFKLDVWYIDHWSLWLDLKILFLTVVKVFKREGISQKSHVTMRKFEGS